MKLFRLLSRTALFAACAAFVCHAAASVTVTLSKVHLCCQGCIDDVGDVGAALKGASLDPDKDAKTITITAADKASAQSAVNALVAAGFYGASSDPSVTVPTISAPDRMTHAMTVSDVEICCGHCVKDINAAVGKVPGVAGTTAAKRAKTFVISGYFNEKAVITALNNAGFSAQIVR